MGLYISNGWSSRLMDCIKDVAIAGLERSAKFSHKSLNPDRYIIGPEHKSFSERCFKKILAELSFPASSLSDVLNYFEKSNQSGFGFEQKNGVSSYRLYLEFFDRYEPEPSLNRGLIHLGYKWQCDDPAKITITRYSFAPFFTGNNTEQVIRTALGAINGNFIENVISAALKSVADISPKNRIITTASEEMGCRHSFDVNVYKSKKRLNSLAYELSNIACYFHIKLQELEMFLEESGNATLGHVAAGLNTTNDPFFTVYFDDFTDILKQRKICYNY